MPPVTEAKRGERITLKAEYDDKQPHLKSEGLFFWELNGISTPLTSKYQNITIDYDSTGIWRYIFAYVNDIFEKVTQELYICFVLVPRKEIVSKGKQFFLHHNADYLDKLFPHEPLTITWYYRARVYASFPYAKHPIFISPQEGWWECYITFKRN